jgi:hypothetical protein
MRAYRIGGYPLIIWAAVIGITLIARRNVATTAFTDDDRQSRLQKTQARHDPPLNGF